MTTTNHLEHSYGLGFYDGKDGKPHDNNMPKDGHQYAYDQGFADGFEGCSYKHRWSNVTHRESQ